MAKKLENSFNNLWSIVLFIVSVQNLYFPLFQSKIKTPLLACGRIFTHVLRRRQTKYYHWQMPDILCECQQAGCRAGKCRLFSLAQLTGELCPPPRTLVGITKARKEISSKNESSSFPQRISKINKYNLRMIRLLQYFNV